MQCSGGFVSSQRAGCSVSGISKKNFILSVCLFFFFLMSLSVLILRATQCCRSWEHAQQIFNQVRFSHAAVFDYRHHKALCMAFHM